MIYFIGDNTGHVKIGYVESDNRGAVLLRMDHLQIGSARKLAILRTIDGAGRATEKWLHRRYADYRVSGEWFVLNREMLTVVPPDELPPKPKPIRQPYDETAASPEVRAWVNADMKARLPQHLHALYDLYYKA